MTAVNTPAGGGLTGGSNTGSANLSIRTDCGTDEGVAWDGDSWECSALGGDVVQSLTTGGTVAALGVNADTTLLYWNPSSNPTLQGIANGAANRRFKMVITDGDVLTIVYESGSATASDRIVVGDGLDWQIRGPAVLEWAYDAASSRWTYGPVTIRMPTLTTTGGITSGGAITDTGNRVYSTVGDGLNSTGPLVQIRQDCGAQSILKWSGSDWLCDSDLDSGGDITNVTAGAGLSGGGSSGSVSLSVGAAAGGGLTVNADDVGITLCAADQSLQMNGTGTAWGCYSPVEGSGAANKVARWFGTSTLTTGQITDDGTNEVIVGNGSDAPGTSNTRLFVTQNGDTSFAVRDSTNDREFFVQTGSSIFAGTRTNQDLVLSRNGSARLYIQGSAIESVVDVGTQSGASFRLPSNGLVRWSSSTNAFGTMDTGLARNAAGVVEINNGTAGTLRDLTLQALTTSSTANFGGAITFNAAGNVGNELTLSGTFVSNGTQTTFGNSDSDYVDSRATFAVSGTNVSTASANCTASGEAQSFTFSRSSGSSGSCVIDFNRTFNSAPYCVVTNSSNKGPTFYVSAVSTTQVTITSSDSIDAYVWCPDRR